MPCGTTADTLSNTGPSGSKLRLFPRRYARAFGGSVFSVFLGSFLLRYAYTREIDYHKLPWGRSRRGYAPPILSAVGVEVSPVVGLNGNWPQYFVRASEILRRVVALRCLPVLAAAILSRCCCGISLRQIRFAIVVLLLLCLLRVLTVLHVWFVFTVLPVL